jgi:hypothetical protein
VSASKLWHELRPGDRVLLDNENAVLRVSRVERGDDSVTIHFTDGSHVEILRLDVPILMAYSP